MEKRWRLVGIDFDHMHMGDLLRLADAHPRIDIVGVADRDPERALRVAGPFGQACKGSGAWDRAFGGRRRTGQERTGRALGAS